MTTSSDVAFKFTTAIMSVVHCPKLIVGGEQMVELAYYEHVYYGHASLGMLLNAK